jgi:hypothetical protein
MRAWQAMHGRRHLATLAACLWAGTAFADQGAAMASRYTRLSDCRQLAHGAEGEDWVSHRCRGLGSVPVWLTYTDSTRAGFGFGAKHNVSGMFNAQRDEAWPLEWRGLNTGRSFQPFAVILRVRAPSDASGSFLVIYRLRPDGTSCIVGSTHASNEVARQIADASRERFSCEGEPQLF